MISEFLNISIKNIRRRRLRSWLTVLGIIISIATIFLLVSVSLGLQSAIQEEFNTLGGDKFFIQPKGQAGAPGSGSAVELTTKDVDVIDKVAGVKSVTYDAIANAAIKSRKETRYVMVAGIPLDRIDLFIEMGFYKIDEGTFLKKGDNGRIMLGSQYKGNFFSNPISARDRVEINGQQFQVQAILQTVGNPTDDKLVYMSLDDFKTLFNVTDRVDQIIIQISPGENITEVADRVDRRLSNFRHVDEKTKDFTVLTPEELLNSFGTVLNILTGFLVGVAAISLLVGAIGIANTMFTSVLERTKEIGVMKAVGAQNKDILLIFLIESGLLGLVGGIFGVILGIIGGKGIEYIAIHQIGTNLLRAATPFSLIIGCLIFSFLIGAISGGWPAWRATKIRPVEALRYE